jgi:hypothetical protein
MEKYREIVITKPKDTRPLPAVDLLNALVERLGVPDMVISPILTQPQNIKQELQLYLSTAPVDENMDPLKFWEVCTPSGSTNCVKSHWLQ